MKLTPVFKSSLVSSLMFYQVHKFLIILVTLFLFTFNTKATTYYVKANAIGANNGSSWADAYTNLYSALNLTLVAGDTVKVAKGTYVPQPGSANFFTLKNGVILLAGYPNTGNPTNAERNWSLNQTILSGTNNHGWVLANTNFLTSSTLIDGFIIEAGYNTASSKGAALKLLNSNPVIKNCVFRNNRTSSGGSNVACDSSKPDFQNCFFINSYDNQYGSVYCNRNSAPVFTNCVFASNTAPGLIAADHSNLKFYNCNFVNNLIGKSGIYNSIGYATITGDNISAVTIANSIFFGNNYEGSQDSADVQLITSSLSISNTITQNLNYGNPALLSVNPKFRDTSNIAGTDGLYFTADDGLQLQNPSAAINKGNNGSITGVTTDIAGNNRIFESIVDLGAYEAQSNLAQVQTVLYVNTLATGLNNGSSWANAFTNLQSAFNVSSDTIKVAKGTYYTSTANKYASFWMEKHRIVLGGYPNTGSPVESDRNPVQNPTILSANLPALNSEKTLIIVHGKNIDSTSILDGMTLLDANDQYNSLAAITFNRFGSGVVRNCFFKKVTWGVSILVKDSSNPRLYDCILDSSAGASNSGYSQSLYKRCTFRYGGGIVNDNANPVIDSCFFLKTGRAVTNINNSASVINNCKFYGNLNSTTAPDMLNDHSSPIVTNCFFSDSVFTDHGGSITNLNGSKPVFTTCEFRNGRVSGDGGTCYNDNSSPLFIKCVFTKSSAHFNGGAFYNANYSSPVIVNCIVSDSRSSANNNQGNTGTFMYSNKSFPTIINSTLVNSLYDLNNGIQNNNAVFVNGDSAHLTIINSVFWNNLVLTITPTLKDILNTAGNATSTVSNCITQAYGINGQNGILRNADPRFIDITNPAGPDNIFFTADDGLRLCSCSPAINAGDNTAVNGYATDILNNSRIVNSTVDIGAYEFQSASTPSPATFYVNASAAGNNNGQSWAGAYTNLQSAVRNPCADTIKIAMGTYKPAITSRDSTFNINRGVTIYGGYPNTGNPGNAQRNTDLYPSVLSGDVGIISDSTDNSRNVLWVQCIDTAVVIDGVTIEKGTANTGNVTVTQNGLCGGGIYAFGNKNLKIFNCIFRNNYAWWGGAVYSAYNALDIKKCVFKNNNSDVGTVNILNYGVSNKITNSVFHNNNAGGYGAGVYTETGATLENLLFYQNTGYRGIGVYIQGTVNAKVTNCNFVKNNSNTTAFGIALYLAGDGTDPQGPVIRNCIFKDNTFVNSVPNTQNSDWATGSFNPTMFNLQFCATITTGFYTNNPSSSGVVFKDINSAIGADNKWFTSDDGLIPAICSNTYNKGENAAVANIPYDIMDSARIMNGIVDIGAYEYRKPAASIVASDTLICPGTLVTFTATVLNTTLAPTYIWRVNSVPVGTNSSTFSSATLNNNDTVDVKMITTESVCGTVPDTAISNRIIIHLTSSIVPSVSITASSINICSGSNVTFTATQVNGGPGYSYQWKKNGTNVGTNSNQYSSATLQNGDIIQVQLTSGFTCANPATVTSNSIIITVNQVPNSSVSITATSTTICTGTNVTFTAIPVNGGTLPAYQWKINGSNAGTNSSSFSTTGLNNNDIVSLIMSGNLLCSSPVTSNDIIMTVNTFVQPSVSMIASATTTCSGSNVTFTATATNGGTSPVYQWKKNGVNTGSNSATYSSNSLANGDIILVTLTSNAPCTGIATVSSNPITMQVNNATAASITISGTTTVSQNSSTLISTSITNSGNSPAFQWQDSTSSHTWQNISGATNSTLNYVALSTGDKLRCILTSNSSCLTGSNIVTSNTLVFTVNSLSGGNVQGNFRYYPNPATNTITLDSLSLRNSWETVTIINVTGAKTSIVQNITGLTKTSINIAALPAGFYIAILNDKQDVKVFFKFVKL